MSKLKLCDKRNIKLKEEKVVKFIFTTRLNSNIFYDLNYPNRMQTQLQISPKVLNLTLKDRQIDNLIT
jgi:hypothetical protein